MKRVISGRLKQFDVIVDNRVGSLADVCDILAANAVNIKALSTEVADGNSVIKLITSDDSTTRNALDKAKKLYTEADVLVLRLLDRPGELAKATKLLAKEGVNIESIYMLGTDPERGETEVVVKVDDHHSAGRALNQ